MLHDGERQLMTSANSAKIAYQPIAGFGEIGPIPCCERCTKLISLRLPNLMPGSRERSNSKDGGRVLFGEYPLNYAQLSIAIDPLFSDTNTWLSAGIE
jgi:hypothetical protein